MFDVSLIHKVSMGFANAGAHRHAFFRPPISISCSPDFSGAGILN